MIIWWAFKEKIILIRLQAILGDFLGLPFRASCIHMKIALLPKRRNKAYSAGYVWFRAIFKSPLKHILNPPWMFSTLVTEDFQKSEITGNHLKLAILKDAQRIIIAHSRLAFLVMGLKGMKHKAQSLPGAELREQKSGSRKLSGSCELRSTSPKERQGDLKTVLKLKKQ